MFFTSLVGNNRLGREYLALLERVGEVASLHASDSLVEALSTAPFRYDHTTIGNMAYYQSATQG